MAGTGSSMMDHLLLGRAVWEDDMKWQSTEERALRGAT